jgi:hypothetical protein
MKRGVRISRLLLAWADRLRGAASGAAAGTCPLQQVLRQILEDRRVQLVSDLLSVPFGGDEPRISKHGKMSRDGRPAGLEAVGDLSGRERPFPERSENRAPCLVGEGAERAT